MNPGVSLLSFFLYITITGCDRVYVHPFYLVALENQASCKKVEDKEQLLKTFLPISIESPDTSSYEGSLRNKSEEEKKIPFLSSRIYTHGSRVYEQLRKQDKGENILLSPAFGYESLLSLFMGASGQTAIDLQTLLDFSSRKVDPNCTDRIDGFKVLSALSSITESPFHSKEDDQLFFSKISCLFSAPEIYLSEAVVQELTSPRVNFFLRTVDFTNPTRAAEQINAFIDGRNGHRSRSLLGDIDPKTTLLFATYTHFKVFLKGALPLKEPREFWINPHKTVSVPMMTVTGTFAYKYDARLNTTVIKIPLSKDLFLLLLQPINLTSWEACYTLTPSTQWLQKLSPRQIHLTLPKVSLESIYDIKEILVKVGLPELVGKEATLRLLSDTHLTIGKIANQQLLELHPSEADQAQDPTESHPDTDTLGITVNKPFLFAVYKKSDALLYFGRIIDPLK